MNFTSDQQSAIDIKNRQVLLSAAAGSGKTAVLIEHIYTLLIDSEINISLENLLVLSFTDKAATEMKSRLLKRLNDELVKTDDEKLINKLTEQISFINFANISTIHSFCRKIIKQNFHAVELDPSFKLSDTENTELLKQEAILEVLEQKYEEKEENFLKVVELFSNKVMDDKLIETLIRIYEFSMSYPFPRKWLTDVIKNYDINSDLNNNPFIIAYKKSLVDSMNNILKINDYIISELSENTEYEELFQSALSTKNLILDIINAINSDINKAYNILNNTDIKLLPTIKPSVQKNIVGFDKNFYTNIRECYKTSVRDGIIEIKTMFLYKPFDELLNDIKNQKEILEEIEDIILKFDDCFSLKKREKNLLDYDDLEHFAIKILVNENNEPTKIAKEYQKQFYEIMIDEFQDTNFVQETILNAILDTDKPYRNKYMVGDVKQSIYKFRNANPKIFIDNYNKFSTNIENKDVLINLSKNFRSRNGVISGTNYVFKKLMCKDFGGIEYDDNVKLNQGREQLSYDDDFISFLLLENKKNDEEIDEEITVEKQISKVSKHQKEAFIIANKINNIVNGNKPIYVEDKDENGEAIMRKVEYRDITILLRSFTNVDHYMNELKKLDIASIALNKTEYFYEIEIKTILAILTIIDNRTVDISLCSVLTSEIYDITPEEILTIKVDYNKPLYINLLNYIENNDNVLADKLKGFIKNLDNWKKVSSEKSIVELLWDIFNETNYLNIINASKKGERAYINLMILLEKAKQYEEINKKGLNNFLKYIEKSAKAKVQTEGSKAESSVNAVNIMTIHKSKGLEFKVVFLASQGSKFNTLDESKDVVFDNYLGIAFKYFDYNLRISYDTIFRKVIIEKMKKDRLEEDARLLYVAMTRATDKLFISGYLDYSESNINKYRTVALNNEESLVNYFNSAKCYLDLIMPTVIKHKDFQIFRDYINIDSVHNEDSQTSFEVSLIDDSLLNIDEIEHINLGEMIQDFSIENIDLSKLYESNKVEKTPINITISELKQLKLGKTFDRIYRKPSFMLDEVDRKFSGAEKGTILHKYLEYINKHSSISQLKELCEKLIKEDILTEDEAKTLNFNKIKMFLDSDLYTRINNSESVFKEKAFAVYIDKKNIYNDCDNNEKLLIHGVIDLYFYEEDYIVLVDYKTDFINEDNQDKLIDGYKIQMEIYKEAIEKAENKKVKNAYVYSFSKQEVLTII